MKLYHMRMMVEQVFKPGKKRLNLNNLRWRGAAKFRMHVALSYSLILAIAITAHKIGKPELAHSIKTFQWNYSHHVRAIKNIQRHDKKRAKQIKIYFCPNLATS